MRIQLSWLGQWVPVGMSILAVGCHVSVHGRASGGSQAQSGQNAQPVEAPPVAPVAPAAGSNSGAQVKGRMGAKWTARAELGTKFKWSRPACEQIGPSQSPPPFAGVHLHGKGVAKIKVDDSTRPVLKVPAGAKPTAPPAVAQPVPPPAVAQPVPPPDSPPGNPFGYSKPVRACFEGQVFFLQSRTGKLPESYAGLEASSVVYACEWDVPTRAWRDGFPGVEQRFEWFAIRYSGKFAVAKAGKYSFRVSSDDGSRLTIDGKVVVDNDGVHGAMSKSGEAELTAGDHALVLEYFQGPPVEINLQVYVTPPEGQEGLFTVR